MENKRGEMVNKLLVGIIVSLIIGSIVAFGIPSKGEENKGVEVDNHWLNQDSTNNGHSPHTMSDIPLQEGWPQETGWLIVSSPVVRDIDGDGTSEVIVGSFDGKVYAWHYNGSLVSGWPVDTKAAIQSSPAVGDIDGDGDLEIVIGFENFGICGGVYAWHHNGTVVKGWPKTYPEINGASFTASPCLGDIDGDGDLEIIAAEACDWDSLWAWHGNGELVKGWPVDPDTYIASSPAVADIDNDGLNEIIVGGAGNHKLMVYNGDGTAVKGWPQIASDKIYSSPAIGDIDNDGDLEIVVTSGTEIYAWHHDGIMVEGWPQNVKKLVTASPALANIDEDDELEIIIGTGGYEMYVFNHNGSIVNGWPQSTGKRGQIVDSATVGDIDGDGDMEIIVGCRNFKVFAWHHDGTRVKGFPLSMGSGKQFYSCVESSPALGDIDNDGDIEVVIGSLDYNVYVWDLPGPYNPQNIEWSMFHHDQWHTGLYYPDVCIKKPKEGYLYLFDREIIPTLFGRTIIIGGITIEVVTIEGELVDKTEKVEFYVDESLMCTVYQPPYKWKWDERAFWKHTLTIKAHYDSGKTRNQEIEVIIFDI